VGNRINQISFCDGQGFEEADDDVIECWKAMMGCNNRIWERPTTRTFAEKPDTALEERLHCPPSCRGSNMGKSTTANVSR
jgi:hypothetical protein